MGSGLRPEGEDLLEVVLGYPRGGHRHARPHQVRRMVDRAAEELGGVDVLVNNAGQGVHVPLQDVALDDLVAVTELNVYAPVDRHASRRAADAGARGGGSIVNVSSGTTLMLPRGTGAYAATKAALNMLSSVARAEWADDGIFVSTVYPFVTATEFHQTLRAGAGPGRRPGLEPQSAEHVADAIAELIRSGEEEAVLVPERLRT